MIIKIIISGCSCNTAKATENITQEIKQKLKLVRER